MAPAHSAASSSEWIRHVRQGNAYPKSVDALDGQYYTGCTTVLPKGNGFTQAELQGQSIPKIGEILDEIR